MKRDELISEIQRRFKSSCPNGVLLKWDRNRFYDSLLQLFVGYKVKNQTDFNYSYCNSFDVEMNARGASGQFYKLTLKISFIVDAYTLHLTEYSNDKKRGKVISSEGITEVLFIIKKIKQFMEQKGFQEIYDDMNVVVPNVELELAKTATIGKCLFDDFG